ncbi:MAG: asparagine synthetase B family protein [Burkholderiaceae bacterium]
MTLPAARIRLVDGARRSRHALPRSALAGSVDLLALEPGVEFTCRDFEDETVISAPGVDLRFDARYVEWHASSFAVTFLLGAIRLDGRAAGAAQVDRLLAEDMRPWSRLGGRYALVRVDLAAGEVLLATDRFGVVPLAWSQDRSRIAFSDRADGVPLDERELDPQSLFDYVYFHVIPAPRTVFRGVHRMEPATALRVSPIAVRAESTWQPPFAQGKRRSPSHDEFRAAVRAAVLDTAGGTSAGCFLSGGTDSSTVAGMLARESGRVKTFSIGFDVEGYDEMTYARIAARHFGTDHHEYYVTADDLVRGVPLVATHYDQPFGNSSAVPAYYCARMAGHSGVRRILAGDGGDELFGGNLRYARQKLFESYRRVPLALRSALLEPLLLNRAVRDLPGLSKASSYVTQACVPMPARMETYNLLGRFGAPNVFTPRFLEQVNALAPAALQSSVYQASKSAPFIDRMLAYDWRFTLSDNDLPKVTGTTRLAGIEVGFPLLADSVVDLSLRLSPDDKVRGLRLRHFFKEALAGFLPPEIIAKKKHGFGSPVGPWLVTNPKFRELAFDALNGLVDRGLIQRALVDDLFSRRLEEHPGYYGEMVWVLMMLEHWMRSHVPSWSCR